MDHDDSKKMDAVKQLISSVLLQADQETLKTVVSDIVRSRFNEYDVKDIITKAITPFVSNIVADLMKDSLVLEALQLKVKTQLIEATQRLTINLDPRRY